MYHKLLLLSLVVVLGVAFLPMDAPSVQAQGGESDDGWEFVMFDSETNEVIVFDQDGNQTVIGTSEAWEGTNQFVLSPNRRYLAFVERDWALYIEDLQSGYTLMALEQIVPLERTDYRLTMGGFSPDSSQFAVGYWFTSNEPLEADTVITGIKTLQISLSGLELTSEISFTNEQNIYPDFFRWETNGIHFRPNDNRYELWPQWLDYVWQPKTNIYSLTDNLVSLAGWATGTLSSTGENVGGSVDYSFPHGGGGSSYGRSFNVIQYYENGSVLQNRGTQKPLIIYTDPTALEYLSLSWVASGDAVLAGTSEKILVIYRDGRIVDLLELDVDPIETENGTITTDIIFHGQTYGTPDGFLLYNDKTSTWLNVDMSSNNFEVSHWATNSHLSILERPELIPSNPIPFTAIEPYDWGEPICDGVLPTRLEVGSTAQIVKGFEIPVHFEPREDSLQVYQIGSFAHLLIFDGPECVNGHPWWKVSYTFAESGLLHGWVQEFEGSTYWLEPRGISDSSLEVAQDFRESNTPSNYPSNTEYFCPGYLNDFALSVGIQGQVLPGDFNNVRSEPFGDAELIGQIPGEGVFEVVDGPRCSGDVLWWKVDYNGTIGWTGEGIRNIYWVEPYSPEDDIPTATVTACEGFLPSRLSVGEPAKVTPGAANNVRTEARYDAELVGQIPGGASFTVLDGPVCGENSAWWQVEYEGITGWTAEGQGDTYWLKP